MPQLTRRAIICAAAYQVLAEPGVAHDISAVEAPLLLTDADNDIIGS